MRRRSTPGEWVFVEDNGLVKRSAASPRSPFVSRPTDETRKKAKAVHESRSPHAQRIDESRNARIASSYSAWKSTPGRYDWPEIDTIPASEIKRRAKAFSRANSRRTVGEQILADTSPMSGMTTPVVSDEGPAAVSGIAPHEHKSPRFLTETEGVTRAHEAAHELDIAAGSVFEAPDETREFQTEFLPVHEDRVGITETLSDELFTDAPLREEAERLSRRMRGAYEDKTAFYREYREDPAELMADVFTSFAVEPGAAQRNAPALADRLDDELIDRLGFRLDELW